MKLLILSLIVSSIGLAVCDREELPNGGILLKNCRPDPVKKVYRPRPVEEPVTLDREDLKLIFQIRQLELLEEQNELLRR